MPQSSLRVVSGLPFVREKLTQLYAARARGDMALFAAGFAPDGVFHLLGEPRLVPEAGPRSGRAAIQAVLESLFRNYESIDGLLVDMIIDLNAALVRRHVTLRSVATGAIGEFEVAEHLRFRDGDIVELVQFMDTASMAVLSGRI
ncbi:MAG: nuclear transport factor 2 family protein [Rhizobiales bacterium]|nr:nuclear transport factor 2 family protein [Hyphomicrobiales bacterium]